MASQTSALLSAVAQSLADPRDRVLFGATPLLMMPRFGTLPPLPPMGKRYVAATDGLYLQARSRALEVTLRYAPSPSLPFGSLTESVHLPGGPIPRALFEELARQAAAHAPLEWAARVHWNSEAGHYEWTSPKTLKQSCASISYENADAAEDRLILDIHSHGHLSAFFSAADDASDNAGLYFASVLGHCHDPANMMAVSRIVVDGFHYALPWHPWEEATPSVNCIGVDP